MGNDDNKEDLSSSSMLDNNTLFDDNQYNLKDKGNYGNKTLQQSSSISNILDVKSIEAVQNFVSSLFMLTSTISSL